MSRAFLHRSQQQDSTRIHPVTSPTFWRPLGYRTTRVSLNVIWKNHEKFLIPYLLFRIDLFFHNEIDMAMFTTLKEEDLISIGITSFGARKIMLNSIKGKLNISY